jgi:hypothetical protein
VNICFLEWLSVSRNMLFWGFLTGSCIFFNLGVQIFLQSQSFWVDGVEVWGCGTWYAICEKFLHFGSKMNPWTWARVDEPGSRVEGGEPVLCDFLPLRISSELALHLLFSVATYVSLHFFCPFNSLCPFIIIIITFGFVKPSWKFPIDFLKLIRLCWCF